MNDPLTNLPHGDGFRFVNDIRDLVPGFSGTGTYEISGKEDFFRGHFPGRPIMPAVILVEALAQLGGVIAQSDPDLPTLTDMRLTAMRNVKVYGTAVPGETLLLTARVAGRLGNLIQIEGQVDCADRKLVTAQLTLSGGLP
ncbi:MAG: 3-hydroxyacyl-[acyl-carrier-protein] dehydratase [Verrucomicrobiales bacterium]|jgi:3-hydroxyacyl-[acyl-carrier-protein] dehydratase